MRLQPGAESLRQIGKTARFPGAEKKLVDPQRGEAPHQHHRRRETRPPQHDAHQHAARTQLVAHPAAGNLGQCVGQREGPEHRPHLRFAQAQVVRDERRGFRDRHPVDVGQHGQRDGKYHHVVARVRRLFGRLGAWHRGHGPLCHHSAPSPGNRRAHSASAGRNS